MKSRFGASSPTRGRVKNQATTTSRIVETPRKKAKPRTGPTVSWNSTMAPMKLEMSAARIVRKAREKRALGGAAQRAPGLHLVLEALEVHDVAVDGDADRHDDAGDAGEAQRHAEVAR